MSYARFGWDGSDVYVFLNVGGYFSCCACALNRGDNGAPFPASEEFGSTAAMLDHLEAHRAAGDTVPDDTLERLRDEASDNEAWIADVRAAAAEKSQAGGR
jgi:hypothetical protein